MPTAILNNVSGMRQHQGRSIKKFGKDCTGLVTYHFNKQGFRGNKDFDFVPDYAFFGCSLVFGIGVTQENIFPSFFERSHNYGLAGNYDNHDIMQVMQNFLSSDLYHKDTHIAVVWHERDQDSLLDFYRNLSGYKIQHFYCGTGLSEPRCHSFPLQLDHDVSSSHPGPKTHKMFSKMLCALFDRS
jgi:hypothetical protein